MTQLHEVPNPIINLPFEEPLRHYVIKPGEPAHLEDGRRPAMYYYRPPNAAPGDVVGEARPLPLVNDLRELSLAESGQLPLEKMPTDLKALAAETLQALEPLAVEKGVSLVDNVPRLPACTLDPFRLRQVLFNLLSNALRHTPAGGKISLSAESGAGWLVLAVQDTGEGLEPGQLPAVFDRFYRADKSRSRDTGGTGLGLAIVKAIVEAHGGQVQADSAGKNQGSRFTIRLPMA